MFYINKKVFKTIAKYISSFKFWLEKQTLAIVRF